MIKLLAKIKANKLSEDVQIVSPKLKKRYRIKTCLFIIYSIKILHKTSTGFLTMAFISLTIFGYFQRDSGFHLVSVVYWSVLTVIWVANYYAVVVFVISVVFASVLYLKYKYIEINDMFHYSLNMLDTKQLNRAMRCHNSVSALVKDITGYGNVFMFQLYYCSTPAMEFLLNNWHDPNSSLIWKINVSVIFTTLSLSLGYLVFFLSGLTRSAHKPEKVLRKILRNELLGLNTCEKLKVCEFIEHLSCGPSIGFYCLDLFPMSSKEFAQYIMFCSFSYIMILQNL